MEPTSAMPEAVKRRISYDNSTSTQEKAGFQGRKIQVMKSYKNNNTAIYGIGRYLTSADIGKMMVRTAPRGVDWSYSISNGNIESIKKYDAMRLLSTSEECFVFEKLCSERKLKTKVGEDGYTWNDENWIDLESYAEFINSHDIDSFEKITDPNTPGLSDDFIYSDDNEMSDFDFHLTAAVHPVDVNTLAALLEISASLFLSHFSSIGWQTSDKKEPAYQTEQNEWLKQAKQTAEGASLSQNTCFEFKRPPKATKMQASSDSLEILKAKRLLGVDDHAELNAIRKAYFAKALHCHPDKVAGRESEFRSVKAAYELLAKELDQSIFNPAAFSDLDELFQQAIKAFEKLSSEVRSSNHQIKLKAINEFYWKLKNVGLKSDDSQLQWNFDNLVKKCHDRLFYLRLQPLLDELNQLFAELVAKKSPDLLIEELPKLIDCTLKLYKDFDLDNSNKSWLIVNSQKYRKAALRVIDSLVAYHRKLAEAYLTKNEEKPVLELRKTMLDSHLLKFSNVKTAIKTAELAYSLKVFIFMVEDLKREKPKAEEPKAEGTTGSAEGHPLPPQQPKLFQQMPHQPSEPLLDRLDLLEKNIEANLAFFSKKGEPARPVGFIRA